MSGFAVIVRFDGGAPDARTLTRMLDAIDYRGPDGRRQWSNGQAAIGHLMLHTTSESLTESQPFASNDCSLILAMDGWLANPAELRRDLTARGAMLRTSTDAELVLRAYETWGTDCPRYMDGEYAFVVWNDHRRELVCVKDHAGLRPLHYHWDGRRLLVASDLAGVLAAGDFEPVLNKGMLAEHLAREFYSVDETVWEGAKRLVPAHVMVVNSNGPRLQRYWTPPHEVNLRYPRDEDYQEHYRELLLDCVRRASRSHRPLACEVSGGHDSSAVFSLAHRLFADGRLLAPELAGYTYNFGDDTDEYTNDLPFARSVAAFTGREITEIRPFMPELEWFSERARLDRDLPPYPNAAMAVATGTALTAAGSRVALNGEGGDAFLGSYRAFYYAEQLREGDWRTLLLSLREDSATFGSRYVLQTFYRDGFGALIPANLRRLRGKVRRSLAKPSNRQFLSPAMNDVLEARRDQAESRAAYQVRDPARRFLRQTLERGFTTYVRDFISRSCARQGYDVRSPLYSRKLIEFAFSIPERQRCRADVNKYFHLGALKDDLPQDVLCRKRKASFNLAPVRQLDKARSTLVRAASERAMDWLQPGVLQELFSEYDRQPTELKPVYPLWTLFGCLNLLNQSLIRHRSPE